jgi:hypothetical protein
MEEISEEEMRKSARGTAPQEARLIPAWNETDEKRIAGRKGNQARAQKRGDDFRMNRGGQRDGGSRRGLRTRCKKSE